MSRLSNVFQFMLGFILGVAVFTAGAVGAAYFILGKMAKVPPRPIFAEEQQATTASGEEVVASAKPLPAEELPAGAYKARVTASIGLYVREEPTTESNRIGAVAYNAEIMILGASEDQQWQKIRIPETGEEGWVKAGNVETID
ncbi:MAG: SH3 domain-containing protein [Gomphosphaeria aponina SAG 52.96 = DSM 107014]|uniref:SH3 domain-containing protein n=1 Tax=Gomphosphaeria aponina SAG 52.96 = DSM 107014 TaxID=1521640 RepID=A0A941GWH0_9CHRO|nr:SH3 domain-containing protein [Gomphosphaeria aponina SAG 52.96 = DSM 107014]